jgi:hypothetical protein
MKRESHPGCAGGAAHIWGSFWGDSLMPARGRWRFLTRGVSLKTALLAFVPLLAWMVFLFLFVSAYRAVVHVQGPAGTILGMLRTLVEIVTVVIAFKYFFEILLRGVANELSVHPKDHS